MPGQTVKRKVIKYSDGKNRKDTVLLPVEHPFTVFLNEKEIVNLMITPAKLKEFAVGFLLGQGIISEAKAIKTLLIDKKRSLIWIETFKKINPKTLAKAYMTTGCAGGISFKNFDNIKKLDSKLDVAQEKITFLMKQLLKSGKLYQSSGGVHSAAIADSKKILYIAEDIGRHNAIDKALGWLSLKKINPEDKLILTTGRVSMEMVPKVARSGISVIVSHSAATSLAVKLAKKFGLTVFGYVRAGKLTVYS